MNDFTLPSGEVHLWYLFPDEFSRPHLLLACEALLASDECARRDSFVFPVNRIEYLLTRALARTTLSRYAQVAPTAWTFQANEYGRPELSLAGYGWLRFNLSNTPGLIACAVVRDLPVGIDVEDTQHRGHTIEIAESFFSPAEVAELRALPPAEQPSRFFDYWTLKEAYIKARGLGLSLPLAQFTFVLGDEANVSIRFGPEIVDDPAAWYFARLHLTSRHRTALALRRGSTQGPDPVVRVHRVSPSELAARATL